MNDAEIEIVVEPEHAEYRRILRDRAKVTIKNNRLGLGVVLAAIIIWTFNTLVIPDFDSPTHRIVLLALSIFFSLHLAFYGLFIYSIRLHTKRWFGVGEPITYNISSKGLKSSTKLITWKSPWDRFPKIVETESDFFFILANDDLVPIPKRFILDQAMLFRLRRLISENATGTVELLS